MFLLSADLLRTGIEGVQSLHPFWCRNSVITRGTATVIYRVYLEPGHNYSEPCELPFPFHIRPCSSHQCYPQHAAYFWSKAFLEIDLQNIWLLSMIINSGCLYTYSGKGGGGAGTDALTRAVPSAALLKGSGVSCVTVSLHFKMALYLKLAKWAVLKHGDVDTRDVRGCWSTVIATL